MRNKKTRLIRSMIRTPDGTVLESCHVHDYVTHKDTITGEEYMLDGGLAYQRTNINNTPALDMSVYEDDPHEVVRRNILWGTYGKGGDQPLKRVKLSDMSCAHIQAVLDNCPGMHQQWREAFIREQNYRHENNIKLEDK